MVEVRYFAAIADATGRTAERIDLPIGATVGDLTATLTARYGSDLARMLTVAAFLIGDELTRDPTAPLAPRVDILPPFAGG
ncbi:MAG: MoaD/ThiS family protein [Mycobacteriaceae bacterium]|nr:MoaD/ThiS family protein [Mycobacteriaceae bacterium]